jgi:glycine oxidase
VPVNGRWAGALHFPEDALVDPRDLMCALRVVCERANVKIKERMPAREIRLGAGTAEVIVPGRAISTEVVVLAAGAWSSKIPVTPSLALPRAEPVRGHLIGFHAPAHKLGPIQRRGHAYLVPRANGELVAGASSERVGFDRAIDDAAVAEIRRQVAEMLPELAGRAPDRVWNGFRPGLADGEGPGPVIGQRDGSRLWTAYGHYRNGILLAPITAERLSREIIAALGKG